MTATREMPHASRLTGWKSTRAKKRLSSSFVSRTRKSRKRRSSIRGASHEKQLIPTVIKLFRHPCFRSSRLSSTPLPRPRTRLNAQLLRSATTSGTTSRGSPLPARYRRPLVRYTVDSTVEHTHHLITVVGYGRCFVQPGFADAPAHHCDDTMQACIAVSGQCPSLP